MILITMIPQSAVAHDAFGDLGPFYANLLHPVVDPLQAALVIGAAALLARRQVEEVRLALPMFVLAASGVYLASIWLAVDISVSGPPALAALVAGLMAMLPQRRVPKSAVAAVLVASGAFTGLAPGRPALEAPVMQASLGTIAGTAVFSMLSWLVLDTLARRASP
ncbi:HupE/UreJ family protein, partial [Cribrihabitans sp. XS_ASV171]